jgi:hypothetical protein
LEVAGNCSSTVGRRPTGKSAPLLTGKNRRLSSVDPPFSDLLLSDSSPSFFVKPVGKWGRCGIRKRGTEMRNERARERTKWERGWEKEKI